MSTFRIDNIATVTGGSWLRRPHPDVELDGVGIDSREDLTRRAFIAIRGERHDGHDHILAAVRAGALLIIVDRRPDEAVLNHCAEACVLLVEDCRKAMARLALAHRRSLTATKVIAVTGSAGKTTTKRLIHAVLSKAMHGSCSPKSFNNEIGVPLTLLAASPRDRYLVVEVGTNHPGEIAQLARLIEPDIAVVTMVGRSHLAGLGSVVDVAKEKASLLAYLRDDGCAIVNADSSELRPYLRPVENVILFGEAQDGNLRLTNRGREGDSWWIEINGRSRFRLGLPGKHNALNALAAVAVGRRLGISDTHISDALASVRPEAMRLAEEAIAGITVFNDAYNANPDSTIAAIETFAELAAHASRRLVILGDMLELGHAAPDLHREVGRHVLEVDRRCRIEHAVLVGPLSAFTAEAISRGWPMPRLTAAPELTEESMARIAALMRPGDFVLVKGSRGVALERLIEYLKIHATASVTA